MKRHLVGLVTLLLLAACRSSQPVYPPEWQAIDGSRSDGTVTLAYEQSYRSRLLPRAGQDNEVAKTRCHVWGYTRRRSTLVAQREVAWQHIRGRMQK